MTPPKWTEGLFLLFFLNLIAWIPFVLSGSYHIGLGHDSQIYEPCINALFWRSNLPLDPVLRLYEARVDIFSFPGWSVLYPFRWAFSSGTVLPYRQLLTSTTTILVFHQVCASFTFFMLLRGLRCRPLYAAFGGMGYAYSLHLQNWASWLATFTGFTWLPLCLLGILLIMKEKRFTTGIFLIAVGYGLVSLASSFAFLYTLALSIIFFLATVPVSYHGLNVTIKKFGSIGLGGLLGAMVGAPALIPVFTRSAEYIRWFSGGSVEGGLQVPYAGTLVSPIDKWGFLHLIFPLEYGNSLGDVFVGSAILFLSGYLVVRSISWRRFAIVLFAGALYFLLDAMGDATPIHHLTYHIPFLSSIRYPISGGIVVVVCLLITGFLGVEQLSQDLSSGRSRRPHGVVLLVLGTILLIITFILRNNMTWIYKNNVGFSLLILSVSGILIAAILLIINTKRIYKVATPFILLASFFPLNTLIVQEKILQPNNGYLSCTEFLELTEDLSKWKTALGENTRLATWFESGKKQSMCLSKFKLSDDLINSVAMASGWNVSVPYLSPRPSKEFHLFNKLSRWNAFKQHDKLLKAGVTHVLSNLSPSEVPSFYTKTHDSGSFSLYAIEDAMMGMNVVGCIESLNGTLYLINDLGSRAITVDPNDLEELVKNYSCNYQTEEKFGVVDVFRSASGTTVKYRVDTSNNLLFVTDRVYNDNWEAQVNNRSVKPIIIDGYRLAIALNKGENKIKLVYRPKDFILSAMISICGIFLLVCIGVYSAVRLKLTEGEAIQ
jgi:Bacterial membrane protein YfhO